MEDKTTPGEWAAGKTEIDADTQSQFELCYTPYCTEITDGTDILAIAYGKTPEECADNAQLIANAKRMRDALIKCKEHFRALLIKTDGPEEEENEEYDPEASFPEIDDPGQFIFETAEQSTHLLGSIDAILKSIEQ